MKTWRKVQKTAIIIGMTYGIWLGGNIEATNKDSFSAMVIVVLALVVTLSMMIPETKR